MLAPLAVLLLGVWEQQRGGADLAELETQRLRMARTVAILEARPNLDDDLDMGMQFRRDGQTYVGSLALAQAREALDDVENAAAVARWRRYLPPVVIGAAVLVLGVSALVLLAASVLGWRGRASRDALARGFSLVRRALPLALAVQVLSAAVAAVAVVAFEATALLHAGKLSGGDIKMLGLAVILMAASVWIAGSAVLQLRRTLAAFDPDPLQILGRQVSREEAPGLWRLLDDLAERLGALCPDNVVVGLTGGFFVSSGPKVLEPGGAALAGRTLYLPLPYLPLLREDEVAAIIGHELAHFSGGDTEYSLRFVPIYAGVGRSLDAVATAGGAGAIPWLLQPALLLGVFVMERFHHAVRHWSRLREFAADAAGARATSADAAARALLRTSAAQPRIDETLEAAASAPDAASPDLVDATLRHAAARGLDDPAGHLEEEQPHPTDTHPPTRQRLAALGRPPEPVLLAETAALPEPPSRLGAFFAESGAICRAATDDFLSVMRQNARAFREELEAAVADVGSEERVLHENTRGGGLFIIGMSVLFVLTGLIFLAIDLPGLGAAEESILAYFCIAAGLGLAGYGILLLRRGKRPFLILRPEEMVVPGVSAPIAWEHVADLDMALNRGRVVTRLLLPPEAPFPTRLPGSRRVKLDSKRRIVTLTAGLPRGMKAPDFAELIGRYQRAADARRLLAEEASAGDGLPERSSHSNSESVVGNQVPLQNGLKIVMQTKAKAPRPLSLPAQGGGWKNTFFTLLGTLMFGAMLVAACIWTVPVLVSDWQIRGTAQPVADSEVLDGKCRSQLILHICNATLSVATEARQVSRRVNYVFTGVHFGDYDITVLADPARPELATTDLALDKLWNRTITVLVGGGILLALTIAPVVVLTRRWRAEPS